MSLYPTDNNGVVGLLGGKFTDEVQANDQPASRLPASHLNLLTDLLATVIQSGNGNVNNSDAGQLLEAIAKFDTSTYNNSLSTLRGGVSGNYDTLAKLLSLVTGSYIANTKKSSSTGSSSSDTVATSAAVKLAYDRATSANNTANTANSNLANKLPWDHLPIGAKMLWDESDIPFGWTLCNGVAKTDRNGDIYTPPNVTDRFILITNNLSKVRDTGGSSTTSSNGAHTHGLSGLTIGATTLTEDQMPSHDHISNLWDDIGNMMNKTYEHATGVTTHSIVSSIKNGRFSSITSPAGGSQSHTHPVSGGSVNSSGAHTHTLTPPYYKLALIAYIGA